MTRSENSCSDIEAGDDDEVKLHWTYSPRELFEEPTVIDGGFYTAEIDDGKIVCRITSDYFETHPDVQSTIGRELDACCKAAGLSQRTAINLADAGLTISSKRYRPATLIITLSIRSTQTLGLADLIVRDAEGNIVGDPRKERIARTNAIVVLAVRHSSHTTSRFILDSFNTAKSDPDNALVHLYEVWEAVSEKLKGTEAEKLKLLGVSRNERSRLTCLANTEPLKQGRHRGQHVERLRDATMSELDEARCTARKIIVGYLRYMDTKPSESR